jgi:hypothetical protein
MDRSPGEVVFWKKTNKYLRMTTRIPGSSPKHPKKTTWVHPLTLRGCGVAMCLASVAWQTGIVDEAHTACSTRCKGCPYNGFINKGEKWGGIKVHTFPKPSQHQWRCCRRLSRQQSGFYAVFGVILPELVTEGVPAYMRTVQWWHRETNGLVDVP